MLDIKFIKENADLVQKVSEEKGYKVDVSETLKLYGEQNSILQKIESLRKERNELSALSKNSKPTEEHIKRGKEIKLEITHLEESFKKAEDDFLVSVKKIPNIYSEDVPKGKSENENVVVKTVGEIPKFKFTPKNHWQLGEAKHWIDKERATKVAGARFAYLMGDFVRLEWALMRFAMDILTDEKILKKIIKANNLKVSSKVFIPVLPPYMIKTEQYDAMDRLEPREERYKIEGEDLWLQGSAEHVLGSMHSEEIFNEADLPLRYVGFATSFRKEAGSYGKDMEGIIRLHQFNKMELESFSVKENGMQEHLFFVAIQEYLMKALELPYRVVMKCTADIGKPNARGIDIDVWLPGQNKYRETHTADYMTDYQARRLKTRVRRADNSVELIHTNDATALSERPLIAILENNQREDGTIEIPKVLRPYMLKKKFI
ncbi:MAG: serine--tRNA ligase [Candidatus Pacebacteria bacterium]|nr:serine--tRNA ligase [Candidatus Paceibacterota bacterium]